MVRGQGSVELKIKAAIAKAQQKVLEKIVKRLAEATPVDTGVAAAGWRIQDNKIVNDVDYISDLNAGSSQQAPAYFVERIILSTPEATVNGSIVTHR